MNSQLMGTLRIFVLAGAASLTALAAAAQSGAPSVMMPRDMALAQAKDSKPALHAVASDPYAVWSHLSTMAPRLDIEATSELMASIPADISTPAPSQSGKFILASNASGSAGTVPPATVDTIKSKLALQLMADLGDRHDLSTSQENDLARLFDLAGGIAEREYVGTSYVEALKFSDATFDTAGIQKPASPQQDLLDMRSFLATQEGLDALKGMSPPQIQAIMQMVNPQESAPQQAEPQNDMDVQQTLAGVPSLTFRPEPAAPATPKTTTSASTKSVVRNEVRDVGNGESMLLAGWRVQQTGRGVQMFKEGDMASYIDVSEGMVMGALGEIKRVEVTDGEAFVMFEGGDILRETTRDNIPFKIGSNEN